jgi:hypothetical protein
MVLSILTSIFLIQELMKPGSRVPFATISKGGNSQVFSAESANGSAEYTIIRNQSTLESFWYNHSMNRYPPRSISDNINWSRQMVLVATLGWTSGCDNYIMFLETRRDGDTLYAYVEKFYKRYGVQCAAIRNPYHIILVESAPDVVFIDTVRPDPNWEEVCCWSTFLFVVVVISILIYVWWTGRRRQSKVNQDDFEINRRK